MYFVGAVFLFHFVQQIVHDAALKGSLRRPAAALDRRFSRGRKQSASDGAALPAFRASQNSSRIGTLQTS
jgi:hypothetical protein